MFRVILFFAGLSASALLLRRFLHDGSQRTIPDHEGNYDIDGVSFDPAPQLGESSHVVVSGDSQASDPEADRASVRKVVGLHSA